MEKLDVYYAQAEKAGIAIVGCEGQLPVNKSMSHMRNDLSCYIGVDSTQFETKAGELVAVVHETKHCVTGSFYNRYSPFDTRAKCERRADKLTALELVPIEELAEAVKSPWNSVYDLAEHFEVTEDFMRKALEIYSDGIQKLIS